MSDRTEPETEEPRGLPPIEPAATASTLFVGATSAGPTVPGPVRSLAEFEARYDGSDRATALTVSLRLFFENGGTDARVLRVAGSGGQSVRDPEAPGFVAALRKGGSAFVALERAMDAALVSVPELSDVAAMGDLLDLCAAKQALLLIDAPAAWIAAGALPRELVDRDSAASGVLYAPRVLVSGAGTSPAIGAVAGIYARSDVLRGVWRSPAGLDLPLNGITGLSSRFDQEATDRLLGLAINPLIDFPGSTGPVIWGARTIVSARGVDDDSRFVAVRRLGLHIERSVRAGTHWAEFEPNGAPLWSKLEQSVEAFLNRLYRAGAFAGSLPRQGCFACCDTTTTSQADIEAGRVRLEIGFAPLKPAEFVMLRIALPAARPSPT